MKLESANSKTVPINIQTSRQAMGLPEKFHSSRIEGFERELPELWNIDDDSLIKILESESPIPRRYAAGYILGLRGDPRTKSSKMIQIPEMTAVIGLDASRVSLVAEQFADLGVTEDWILKEVPSHKVFIPSFLIGKYLITNEEYLAFLKDSNWPELPTSWAFGVYPADRANHPVYTVTPQAADRYCEWLSKKTGRRYRLPRECEWEFAASGPNAWEFPWGEEFINDICNTVETGILTTTPVGMFPRSNSFFGVSDLAGNVEEYVMDDYRPYPGGREVRDDLFAMGNYRIARGGSFTRYRDLARCKRRHGYFPKDIYTIGFRIVQEVQ